MTDEKSIVSDWQIEQLRCTAFLQPQSNVAAHAAFAAIADSEPVVRSENTQQGMSSSSGNLDSIKMDVIQLPGRLDVVFQSAEQVPDAPIPPIGAYRQQKDALAERCLHWLTERPSLQRLAMGLIVVAQVPDRTAGYRALQKLLPSVTLDPEHSTDFNYQINRPRLVKIADDFRIKINRLSRWGVTASIFQTIVVRPGEVALMSRPVLVRNVCRIELDLSSDQEVPALPPEHVPSLWQTLSYLADEIISEGDIP